jgi:hypothetical protein
MIRTGRILVEYRRLLLKIWCGPKNEVAEKTISPLFFCKVTDSTIPPNEQDRTIKGPAKASINHGSGIISNVKKQMG